MFRITEERGFEGRVAHTLPLGELVIGRSTDCDIQLKAPDVSRQHLRLSVSEDAVLAEPFPGKRCSVGDRPLEQPARLIPGQRLTLGRTTVLLFDECTDGAMGNECEPDDDEAETQVGLPLPGSEDTTSVTGALPENRIDIQAITPADPCGSLAGSTENAGGTEQDGDEAGANEEDGKSAPFDAVGGDEPGPIQEVDADAPEGDVLCAVDMVETDDEEPMSGFVDFQMAADESDDDDLDMRSMAVLPSAMVSKDPNYEPPQDSMRLPRREAAPSSSNEGAHSDGSAADNEYDAPHTQGLSPEAMEYLRSVQERKALYRRIIIVTAIAGLLAVVSFVIVMCF